MRLTIYLTALLTPATLFSQDINLPIPLSKTTNQTKINTQATLFWGEGLITNNSGLQKLDTSIWASIPLSPVLELSPGVQHRENELKNDQRKINSSGLESAFASIKYSANITPVISLAPQIKYARSFSHPRISSYPFDERKDALAAIINAGYRSSLTVFYDGFIGYAPKSSSVASEYLFGARINTQDDSWGNAIGLDYTKATGKSTNYSTPSSQLTNQHTLIDTSKASLKGELSYSFTSWRMGGDIAYTFIGNKDIRGATVGINLSYMFPSQQLAISPQQGAPLITEKRPTPKYLLSAEIIKITTQSNFAKINKGSPEVVIGDKFDILSKTDDFICEATAIQAESSFAILKISEKLPNDAIKEGFFAKKRQKE